MRKIIKMIFSEITMTYLISPKTTNYRTYNNVDKKIIVSDQNLNKKPINNPIPERSY